EARPRRLLVHLGRDGPAEPVADRGGGRVLRDARALSRAGGYRPPLELGRGPGADQHAPRPRRKGRPARGAQRRHEPGGRGHQRRLQRQDRDRHGDLARGRALVRAGGGVGPDPGSQRGLRHRPPAEHLAALPCGYRRDADALRAHVRGHRSGRGRPHPHHRAPLGHPRHRRGRARPLGRGHRRGHGDAGDRLPLRTQPARAAAQMDHARRHRRHRALDRGVHRLHDLRPQLRPLQRGLRLPGRGGGPADVVLPVGLCGADGRLPERRHRGRGRRAAPARPGGAGGAPGRRRPRGL
ncbi:MAG: Ribonuclease BN, partial [uncultured Rubellimicrobium sp.]